MPNDPKRNNGGGSGTLNTPDQKVSRLHLASAVGAILARLDDVRDGVRDAILSSEQESDYDQAWAVANLGGDCQTISMPRTIIHAEIQLMVCGGAGYLFSGQVPFAVAQQQAMGGNTAFGGNGTGGNGPYLGHAFNNKFTWRDMLDGSGLLTLCVPAAVPTLSMVQVRNLDTSQGRQSVNA